MAEIIEISPIHKKDNRKKRVCAYARVFCGTSRKNLSGDLAKASVPRGFFITNRKRKLQKFALLQVAVRVM